MSMCLLRAGVLALLLANAVSPAFGYRREFRLMLNEQRQAGGEVCFYRARGAQNPFTLFFSYDAVRCLPADQVLDFPPGLFHLFGRYRNTYVSEHRDSFVYDGAPAPERGYQALDIPLREAAVVDFSAVIAHLQPGERIGVWLAPTPTTAGTFFPLVDGESAVVVPAETAVVPLLVVDQVPAAVGLPLYLAAGERSQVTDFQRTARVVVAWVRVERQQVQDAAVRLSPPEIVLVSADGLSHKPLFPLYDAMGASHTLLFFRDVPEGSSSLRVSGRFWATDKREVQVGREGATVVREPLMLVPGGAVAMTWNAGAPAPLPAECAAAPQGMAARMEARLLRCTSETDCRTVASKTMPFAAGAMTFEGVAPGSYRLAVKAPTARTRILPVEVAMARQSELWYVGSIRGRQTERRSRRTLHVESVAHERPRGGGFRQRPQ
jgi:hypothetical protein